jgi:NitT/TauT family transport system permease protein
MDPTRPQKEPPMSVLDKQGADQRDPVPDEAGGKPADSGAESGSRSARGREHATRRGLFLALNAVSVLLGIGLWWVLADAGFTLPTPPQVVSRAGTLIGNGTLAGDIRASLTRVLIGFALGTAAAVPVGFLMGWYGILRGLIEPWIQFFRTIPPLAIIPLAVVIMGIDETPKIFVIFLAAFLACVVATYQGVVNVDRTLINAARVLGAGDLTIFARVVVPASTPFILVGMRVGLGSAWATLVAAELIAAQKGLGYRIQNAQLYYDLPTIFVGLITIGILGLLMDRALLLAERRLTGWQERR